MTASRRRLFGNISASILGLTLSPRAFAAETFSVAPLKVAGLDPLEVYAKVFGSLTPGSECAWWYMGALPRDVPDVGPVDTIQEETVRVHRTDIVKPGQVDFIWREVGVFRDIRSGENPPARFDPVTAKTATAGTLLGGGKTPARISALKDGNGLKVSHTITGQKTEMVAVSASIEGDRVCITHFEEKTRIVQNGPPAPTNRTVHKAYASLADLKSGAPSVPASGFYGVKVRDTGKIFVNGLMHKAAMDERVNPIAWERLKVAHPTFFKGDRLAPAWDGS